MRRNPRIEIESHPHLTAPIPANATHFTLYEKFRSFHFFLPLTGFDTFFRASLIYSRPTLPLSLYLSSSKPRNPRLGHMPQLSKKQ